MLYVVKVHNVRFDICVYYKMIATVTSITPHNYHSISVVTTLKIYSFSKFQLYNTVFLNIINMLYNKCQNYSSFNGN